MLRQGECQCMLMLEYHGYLLYIIYIYMSRCRARYAIVVRTSVQVAAVAVLEGEVPVGPRHLVELNQESMAYVTRLERFAERSNFGLNDAKLNVIVPMKTATLGISHFQTQIEKHGTV